MAMATLNRLNLEEALHLGSIAARHAPDEDAGVYLDPVVGGIRVRSQTSAGHSVSWLTTYEGFGWHGLPPLRLEVAAVQTLRQALAASETAAVGVRYVPGELTLALGQRVRVPAPVNSQTPPAPFGPAEHAPLPERVTLPAPVLKDLRSGRERPPFLTLHGVPWTSEWLGWEVGNLGHGRMRTVPDPA